MQIKPTFTAIDFETATPEWSSICSVGIITVENGEITEEFQTLIRPPGNRYNYYNTRVHGISAGDTFLSPEFRDAFPEIKKRISYRTVVAHNESFDRNALKKAMESNGFKYSELGLGERWECTLKIFKKLGFYPAGLKKCCDRLSICLDHHDALSDARACALLYLYAHKEDVI